MGRNRMRRLITALALTTAVTGGTVATTATGSTAASPTAADATRSLASAARGWEPVAFTRQVTMNVRYSMRPALQRRDIRRATRGADVIGWQEINRWPQARAISRLRGWATYWPGGRRPNGRVGLYATNTHPISWRRSKWALVRGGHRLVSHEIEHVTRERYLTFVVLRHRRSGSKILRWNTHFVPNAMNGAHVRRKAARRVEWHRAARTVAAFLDRMSRRSFSAVIGGGDINWRSTFVGDRVFYDTDHKRIDYLTHVRSPWVTAGSPRFIRMHSDHDKVRVRYTLYL